MPAAGLRGQGLLAADAVDRPVVRRRHEPRPRAGGDAVARPALGGDREGLLRGLLGEVEVAEEADERSEDAAPVITEGPGRESLVLHDRTDLDRAAPCARPGRARPS